MLPVLAAAFVGFFAVANAFFPVIHVSLENPYGDAARLLAYSGIFLPSYAILGALLALYFDEGAAEHRAAVLLRPRGRGVGLPPRAPRADLGGAAAGHHDGALWRARAPRRHAARPYGASR